MATHTDWANMLTHGRATQNASPPFVPTVRAHYGSKGVNGTHRAQDSFHNPEKPPSGGGKKEHLVPNGPADIDSGSSVMGAEAKGLGHRMASGRSNVDRRTPERANVLRAGGVASSSSVKADVAPQKFSPSSPKRAVTVRSSSDGANAERKSRSGSSTDVPQASEFGSPLLASHASSTTTSGEAALEQMARIKLKEKLRNRATRREPHARVASPAKAPSTSVRRSSSQEPTHTHAPSHRQPSPQRRLKEQISQ